MALTPGEQHALAVHTLSRLLPLVAELNLEGVEELIEAAGIEQVYLMLGIAAQRINALEDELERRARMPRPRS